MKNLFTPVPDGHYELKFFAADEADRSVTAFAIFHGTQTGPGGPVVHPIYSSHPSGGHSRVQMV
jgi:hypothetical protein